MEGGRRRHGLRRGVVRPHLDTLYVKGANGGPGLGNLRSLQGSGSIVEVKSNTGKLVWCFQEPPGDDWDYTSTQPIVHLYDQTGRPPGEPSSNSRKDTKMLACHPDRAAVVHFDRSIRSELMVWTRPS